MFVPAPLQSAARTGWPAPGAPAAPSDALLRLPPAAPERPCAEGTNDPSWSPSSFARLGSYNNNGGAEKPGTFSDRRAPAEPLPAPPCSPPRRISPEGKLMKLIVPRAFTNVHTDDGPASLNWSRTRSGCARTRRGEVIRQFKAQATPCRTAISTALSGFGLLRAARDPAPRLQQRSRRRYFTIAGGRRGPTQG